MIMREGCRWAGREVLRIISHRSSAARSTNVRQVFDHRVWLALEPARATVIDALRACDRA
jgi:hypothetical protein